MDSFFIVCNNFGFIISIKKIEVMYQLVLNKQYYELQIMVNGQILQVVEIFIYLGSIFFCNVNIDVEINNRIFKVSSVFGRLWEKVWERRGISFNIKFKVYYVVVFIFLFYGCEIWIVYRWYEKLINYFYLWCF